MKPFDQYDYDKMAKAKGLLMDVLNYNYGAPRMGRYVKRLETIIEKLEILENMEFEERKENG